MSSEVAHTAHFTVDGVWLTEMIQTLMIEGNSIRAWKLATCTISDDGFEGTTLDAALKLVRGTHGFVSTKGKDGSEELELVELSSLTRRKYVKKLRYAYAGIARWHGVWCRPVAKVTSWGPDDLHNNHSKDVSIGGYLSESGRPSNRIWHYCGKDELAIDGDSDIVWRRCYERPAWMEEITGGAEQVERLALADCKEAGFRLEKRGWAEWYGHLYVQHKIEEGGDVVAALEAAGDPDEAARERQAKLDARLAQEAADEVRWREEDAKREAYIAELRVKILEQAAGDLIELKWEGGGRSHWDDDGKEVPHPAGSVMIPRAPFLHWVLDRKTELKPLAPPWEIVSPSGMKLQLDDPYHTDWLIGAGLDLKSAYNYSHPLYDASITLGVELQRALTGKTVAVLVEGVWAEGPIFYGKRNTRSPVGSIVVLPNLRPDFLEATLDAAAVITEAGGATAHLAQVGRERSLPMVLEPGAMTRYAPGMVVTVSTECAEVTIKKARLVEILPTEDEP